MSAKSALAVKGSSAHVAGRSRVIDDAGSMSEAPPGRKSRVAHTSSVLLTLMVEGRRSSGVSAGESKLRGLG